MGGGFWTLALLAVIVLIYLDSKRKSKKADTTINSNEDEIEDKPSLKEKLTDASIAFANELKDKVKNTAKVTANKESSTSKGVSEKVLAKKTNKEYWEGLSQTKKILIVVGTFMLFVFAFKSGASKPSACDCTEILNIPTKQVGYKMFPRDLLGDEEYKKWQDCYDEYAGPATAYLECND